MSGDRSSKLYVDTRLSAYGGGILRYAEEVVQRLEVPWVPFEGPFTPARAIDALNPRRILLPRDALLYSPGYSAGAARCTQLLTIHDLTHLRYGSAVRQRFNLAYYEGFVRPAVKRAGHLITVSETSADEIRNWLADDRVTVHNAGNGCSEVFTLDGPASRFDRPYFLYVGNFKSHKNPGPLFEAMRSFPDHLLVVVSSEIDAAHVLAGQTGIADQLVINSGIGDEALAALYRGSEALVFPSKWEGFGLPVLEALNSGTNVVYCREALSVSEICQGSQFPVGDASDPAEFASQMNLAIRTRFVPDVDLSRFRWDIVASKAESVIRDIAGHPSPDGLPVSE